MKIKHLLLIVAMFAIAATAKAQTTGEKIKAFADEHLRLSGYLQGGFRWDENSDPATSFYLHRARLSLTGDAAKDKVDYRLQVDMAGSPKICDLYVRYKPLKGLNVQIGQFKLPFSYENENCGPTTVEFIEYSYLTMLLARNDGTYDGVSGATGRDIGIQLYGGFIERDGYSIINYNVGVFNGAGINVKKDNNSSKDVIARLLIKPFKGFGVTASYMYAESNFNDERYMKSPRWAAGVLYDSRYWVARAEYAEANFGGTKVRTLYALGGYNFERPWSIYARYEFLNEASISNNERIMLGAAYKPFKFLRMQLNLSYLTSKAYVPTLDTHYKSSLGANFLITAMF